MSVKYVVDIPWLHDQYNKQSKSQQDIADLIGCSKGNVSRLLRKHGIKKASRAFTLRHKRMLRAAKLGKTGKETNNWQGGARRVSNMGYVMVYSPCGVEQYEHRVMAEKALERSLLPKEQVHHIDGVKTNNSLENLLVLSIEDHARLHSFMGAGVYLPVVDQIKYLHDNGLDYIWLF